MPHSERNCFKCGGKGHIAQNCPAGANEVNPGPGGATGVTGGEQPQGLGQPLPGAYTVEIPNDEPRSKEDEVYEQQYKDRKKGEEEEQA